MDYYHIIFNKEKAMKGIEYRRILSIFICIIILSAFFSLSVSADMGPKPSVRITFTGLGDTACYGTLLSQDHSTGPHSVWDGNEKYAYHTGNYQGAELDPDTWQLFANYKDPDGYYFLQMAWEIGEDNELAWTYYPPDSFKILLYFPEYNMFMTSGIYERYAFDSYFSVDIPDGSFTEHGVAYSEPVTASTLLCAQRSYNYKVELITLAARIIITILIESGIALAFGFREKKELRLIIGVNTVTQVILNTALNIISYRSGFLAYVAAYIFFELIVFILEAVIYAVCLKRVSSDPPSRAMCVVYAFVANAVSFVSGYLIADIIPNLF